MAGKAVTLEQKKVALDLHEQNLELMKHEIKAARKLGESHVLQHYNTMGSTRRNISQLKHEIEQIEKQD